MIRILPLVVFIFILCGNPHQTWSQVPLQFNYQGIARNADGLPLVEQKLRIRISLAEKSLVQQPRFVEDHEVRTNIGLGKHRQRQSFIFIAMPVDFRSICACKMSIPPEPDDLRCIMMET
jgi:hypothetical protein